MRVEPADHAVDIAPFIPLVKEEGQGVLLDDSPHHRWLKLVDDEGAFLGCVAIKSEAVPSRVWCVGHFIPPEHRGKGYAQILVDESRRIVAADPTIDWYSCTVRIPEGRNTPLDEFDQVVHKAALPEGGYEITTSRNMKAVRAAQAQEA